MLEYDRACRAYRLAAPVLSLAHAMRSGSPVLQAVGPMMRTIAEKRKINVGLAVADREEMVYLESVRYNRKPTLRNVVAGQRVPIELTSPGRAYLAAASETDRKALLLQFKSRRPTGWRLLEREIAQAIESVRRHGYCVASWQPEVVALATPIVVEGHPVYVLNMSVSTQMTPDIVGKELSAQLMELAARVRQAVAAL